MVRGGFGVGCIKVLSCVISLLLGIILARYLGAEKYGIYAYAFAISSTLTVFAEAGLPTLLLREVAALETQEKWGKLRGLFLRALQLNLATSFCIVCIATIYFWFYNRNMQFDLQCKTLILAILLLPLSTMIKLFSSVLSGLQHVVLATGISELIRPGIVLLLIGGLFFLYPSVRQPHYAMAVQLLSQAAILSLFTVLLIRLLPRYIFAVKSCYDTRYWFTTSFSFALMSGAGILNSQADILLLGFFRTPNEVGLYRVAMQGAGLVAFGLQAANTIVAPQFSRLYAQSDLERLQRLVSVSAKVILLSAVPLALAFIFAGEYILRLLFGKEYISGHIPLAILSAGQLINAAMGSVGFLLTMTGHEKVVVKTFIGTAIFNLAANAALVPAFGIVGAAIATAIVTTVWNIILYKLVQKRLGINSTAFAGNWKIWK